MREASARSIWREIVRHSLFCLNANASALGRTGGPGRRQFALEDHRRTMLRGAPRDFHLAMKVDAEYNTGYWYNVDSLTPGSVGTITITIPIQRYPRPRVRLFPDGARPARE